MDRIFLSLAFIFAVAGCVRQAAFEADALCAQCVADACADASKHEALHAHFARQDAQMRAQLVAVMEATPGCDAVPWFEQASREAYLGAAAAFYGADQPMIAARVAHALRDVREGRNPDLAVGYLARHVEEWKPLFAAEFAEIAATPSDVTLPILVRGATADELERISESEAEDRAAIDRALLLRWPELPETVRARVLSPYISFAWHLQASGSSQLPQYLALDWAVTPLPQGVPEFTAKVRVDSIKVGGKEAKRGDVLARDAVATDSLHGPGARHARVDLQPWLTSADAFRITADATLEIRRNGAGSDDAPDVSLDAGFDRQYRVFAGMETGAPSRIKDDATNDETTKSLAVRLCNAEGCEGLWENGRAKKGHAKEIRVVQGEDLYIELRGAHQPLAVRLMARSGQGKAWREVAAGYGYAPTAWDVPVRADVWTGDLCSKTGPCRLDLQLRPSLRMARRDPRIQQYWGATLDFGTIELDIQNLTPEQIGNAQ